MPSSDNHFAKGRQVIQFWQAITTPINYPPNPRTL